MYARRAADLTKWRDPGILNTLVLAYRLTGDTAAAVESAGKGLALLPATTTGPMKSKLQRELEAHFTRDLADASHSYKPATPR